MVQGKTMDMPSKQKVQENRVCMLTLEKQGTKGMFHD